MHKKPIVGVNTWFKVKPGFNFKWLEMHKKRILGVKPRFNGKPVFNFKMV